MGFGNFGFSGGSGSGGGAPAAHKTTHQLGGTDVVALSQYDKDAGQAGMIALPMGAIGGTSNSTQALSASRAYLMRFVPSRNMTIVSVAFRVTTANASDDSCDVGIYSSDLATKIVSSGATSGKLNSTGVKTIALSASLTAGTVYYAAFAAGTFGGAGGALAGAATNLNELFGTAVGTSLWFVKDSSYVLPSSISTPSTTNSAPVLALRES